MHSFLPPGSGLDLTHNGVPIGAIVTFLFVALRSALDMARRRAARDAPSIWSLWLLGPATVACLLAAHFVLR